MLQNQYPAAVERTIELEQTPFQSPCDDRVMKQVIPETSPEYDTARVFERPDGFYWQAKDGRREYGPFETLIAAIQDMDVLDDESQEPGESLQEAEAEIGISDWIDPETGEPAEANVHHLEDH